MSRIWTVICRLADTEKGVNQQDHSLHIHQNYCHILCIPCYLPIQSMKFNAFLFFYTLFCTLLKNSVIFLMNFILLFSNIINGLFFIFNCSLEVHRIVILCTNNDFFFAYSAKVSVKHWVGKAQSSLLVITSPVTFCRFHLLGRKSFLLLLLICWIVSL